MRLYRGVREFSEIVATIIALCIAGISIALLIHSLA
jgi:hypothetical protein